MMTGTSDSRTAIVTGGNKGIGLAIAKGLAEQGFRVWITARDRVCGEQALKRLSGEGISINLLIMDVADDLSVQKAAAEFFADAEKLDVLVNNAGVLLDMSASPTETDISEMKATFEVNLFGPIRVTQAFLPLLRASKQASVVMLGSGVGSMALITDESSIYSSVNLLSYSASKVALNAATVCFAKELAEEGILVNVVEPGHVKTDLNNNSGDLSPEEGAMPAIKMALAGPEGPTGKFFGPHGPQPW